MHPLVRYARVSRVSYYSANGQFADMNPELIACGLSFLGSRDTGSGDHHCFACRDSSTVVIAFAGTKDARNLAEDLDAIPVFFVGKRLATNSAMVHQGFRDAWVALRNWCDAVIVAEKANGATRVVYTGHSLGAAMATLAASDDASGLPVECWTYGSPRVGMPDFVNAYNDAAIATVRCVHDLDGIPCLPPPGVFQHVNSELRLSDDGSVLSNDINPLARTGATIDGEWLRDHGIERYITACAAYAANQPPSQAA